MSELIVQRERNIGDDCTVPLSDNALFCESAGCAYENECTRARPLGARFLMERVIP